jgi:fatty acid-binding protein DegV
MVVVVVVVVVVVDSENVALEITFLVVAVVVARQEGARFSHTQLTTSAQSWNKRQLSDHHSHTLITYQTIALGRSFL